MKLFLDIEMLPRRQRLAWRVALCIALVLAALLLMADAWRRHRAHAERAEEVRAQASRDSQAARRQAQRQADGEQLLRSWDDMSRPWLTTVSFPWDELLTSVERLKAPSVRVVSLAVDAHQGVASMVLECRDLAQAAELSPALDAGRPPQERRWRLLRARTLPGPSAGVEAELQFSARRLD